MSSTLSASLNPPRDVVERRDRILVLNSNYRGQGTYLRAFHFARELARSGHDVTLMTVSRERKLHKHICYKREWVGEHASPFGDGPWIRQIDCANVGYKWLPGWGSGPLDIASRVTEIFAGKYDVVFGFEYQPNVSWPVYLSRRMLKYRFYSDWCDWYAGSSNKFRGYRIAHRIDGILEEAIRKRARKVSVISKMLYERAIAIGIPRDRVVHIPEGIDTDYIRPYVQRAARRELNLPPDVPIIAAVRDGDMIEFVKVLSRVAASVPRFQAIAIGRPSEPARQLAAQLGISDRIHWTGWVSDEHYPKLLSAADVCVLPLSNDLHDRARFPAKLLDFLAAGRAVVISDIGEAGELVRMGKLGFACAGGSEEMAQAVTTLLQSPDLRQDMGTRARAVMVRDWAWSNRTEQIAAVIRS